MFSEHLFYMTQRYNEYEVPPHADSDQKNYH